MDCTFVSFCLYADILPGGDSYMYSSLNGMPFISELKIKYSFVLHTYNGRTPMASLPVITRFIFLSCVKCIKINANSPYTTLVKSDANVDTENAHFLYNNGITLQSALSVIPS